MSASHLGPIIQFMYISRTVLLIEIGKKVHGSKSGQVQPVNKSTVTDLDNSLKIH